MLKNNEEDFGDSVLPKWDNEKGLLKQGIMREDWLFVVEVQNLEGRLPGVLGASQQRILWRISRGRRPSYRVKHW